MAGLGGHDVGDGASGWSQPLTFVGRCCVQMRQISGPAVGLAKVGRLCRGLVVAGFGGYDVGDGALGAAAAAVAAGPVLAACDSYLVCGE